VEIRPTDRPEKIGETPDVGQSSELAFHFRPELEVARDQIEQNEIQAQFARNQRLPRLDVVGSYGYGGLGGKPKLCTEVLGGCPLDDSVPPKAIVGPVDTVVDRSYSNAHNDFFTDDGALQWSARAVFSIPLGNQRARGRARIAEIELRRSRTQLRRVEQDIILEVRKAVRDVNSSAEGIEAAERRSTAATEQLRAESIRLEHGESTPFDVLLREQDLVEAESQHIFALQAYQDSLAALDRAQGTILRNHNVVVEQARTLR
jgi:outer membrane protein TolC